MKRRIIVTLSCGFIVLMNGYAQSGFFIKETAPYNQAPMDIKSIGDSYFAAIATYYIDNSYEGKTDISRYNHQGEMISSVEFNCDDCYYNFFDKIIPLNQSGFMVIGYQKLIADTVCSMKICKMDTSLNVIWEKSYKLIGQGYRMTKYTICPDSTIMIGATVIGGPPWYNSHVLLMQINYDGNSLRSVYMQGSNTFSTMLSDIVWIAGHFKVAVEGFHNGYSSISTLDVDTNLNVVGCSPTPYNITNCKSTLAVSDSVYYLAGSYFYDPVWYEVGIAKLNETDSVLAFNHAGSEGYIADYAGRQCLVISDTDNLYTGGFMDVDSYCLDTTQKIMLSNYDSLLHCRWTRFYGGDACYILFTMDATPDGGCIVAGQYVDPSNPQNKKDVFLMKVDSMGLFTSIPSHPGFSSHNVNIYPNPFHDCYVIQSGPQIAGAWFRMYDVAGCLIIERKINDAYLQQDMTGSPSGIYTWQVIKDGKVIENGNLIKN